MARLLGLAMALLVLTVLGASTAEAKLAFQRDADACVGQTGACHGTIGFEDPVFHTYGVCVENGSPYPDPCRIL
jgi:hypothetical protein